MKKIILVSVLVFSQMAYSEPTFNSQVISTVRVTQCSSWMPLRGENYGYSCMSPSNVLVPEAYSLSDRLADLEKRIAELEAKLPPTK